MVIDCPDCGDVYGDFQKDFLWPGAGARGGEGGFVGPSYLIFHMLLAFIYIMHVERPICVSLLFN